MRWASSAKGANLVGKPNYTAGKCGGDPLDSVCLHHIMKRYNECCFFPSSP